MMCRLLEVAPSGYYEWLHNPVSDRAKEDARLLRLIRASFVASNGVYGAPRVFLDLREAGETCSKHRVERLMRINGLRALHGYRTRRWSVGKPALLIPNLLQRQFTVTRRNTVWATDITYIRHLAGMVVPRGSHGPVLPTYRWLVRRANNPSRAGAGCRADGGAQAAAEAGIDTFRPGHAVRE
jgi:transposase InsO family protein